jgi:predicted esterase
MPRSEPFDFRAGDVTLAGTLTLPDGPPPEPRRRYANVLLLPSFHPRERDGRFDAGRRPGWFSAAASGPGLLGRLALGLAAHGVAALRYDKRGCGASEGSWEESDLFVLIDDARDAVGALRSRRDLDLARLGLVGHGEGAAIAVSIAIGDPAVGGLTLVGGHARSYRHVLRWSAARWLRDGGPAPHPYLAALYRWSEDLLERAEREEPTFEITPPGASQPRIAVPLRSLRQAIGTPPRALATMLRRSVHIVHAADDPAVSAREAEILAGVLEAAGSDVALDVVASGDHDLADLHDAAIDRIAAALAARLEPRALPPVLVALQDPPDADDEARRG